MRQDEDEPDLRGDAAFRAAQAAQAQADKDNARMDIANLLAPQGKTATEIESMDQALLT